MARTIRTIEERVAELNEKIDKKQAEIAELESKKESLLHPVSYRDVIAKAKENGLSAKEVADRLGLQID